MPFSLLLAVAVTLVGGYMLFKLKFFFIRNPINCIRDFLRANRSRKCRRALFLALAGTLGVGNIFGVAAGIIYGGAGSVFWLAVSSVFAAVLKYSECTLSFDSLADGNGGMHLVLRKSFPCLGKSLASIYAASCVLLALFMGGAMQSGAVSGAFVAVSDKSALLPSVIFAVFVFLGTLSGGERVDRITEKVIPLTMLVYILLCLIAILTNFDSLDSVILTIISDALHPRSAVYGSGIFLFSKQFSEGFARGILSNEAGCGTSSLAHTRAGERTPYIAGLSGICEVFFDTSVLCILTALAILSSVVDCSSYSSPMLLVSDSIGAVFGEASRALLLLSVFAFAYSTVLCWFYYGNVCFSYLFPCKSQHLFTAGFFAALVFGVLISSRVLIEIIDFLLLVLSLLTLSAVICRRERISELTILKDGS